MVVSLRGEDPSGQRREWDPVPLEVRKEHFENGKTDVFVVGREDDLGELKSLTVSAANF